MRKTYVTKMPDKAGAFLLSSKIIAAALSLIHIFCHVADNHKSFRHVFRYGLEFTPAAAQLFHLSCDLFILRVDFFQKRGQLVVGFRIFRMLQICLLYTSRCV